MIAKDSKCLIIVGMHRSGTSYTASVLKQSGLNIGNKLLGAGIGNELGHFENEDFYLFHQKTLKNRNYHSDGWSLSEIDTFDSHELKEAMDIVLSNQSEQWGWKDPRTTLFLDAWKKIIPDAYFLFIYRKPWEVVDSLFRRNRDMNLMVEPILTVENWQFYNNQILSFFNKNKERSILIEIENIMKRSVDLISLLNNRFGFQLNANFKDMFDQHKFKNQMNESHQFFCETVFPTSISLYKQLQEESSIKPWNIYKPSKGNIESWIGWWYDSSQLSRLNKDILKRDVAILERDEAITNRDVAITKRDVAILEQDKIINKITVNINDLEHAKLDLSTQKAHLENELNWMRASLTWKVRNYFKKLFF